MQLDLSTEAYFFVETTEYKLAKADIKHVWKILFRHHFEWGYRGLGKTK